MAPSLPKGVKRKREGDDEGRKDGALQRMYADKQWCDLSIKTSTRTFEVHKSVVCAVCPFMKAACTRGFKEAQSNEIQLPESETVVEAILQHFYQVPVDLLEPLSEDCAKVEARDRALALIDLHVAADKYDVTLPIADLTKRFFDAVLELEDPKMIVQVGLAAYSHPQEQVEKLQHWAAANAMDVLGDISEDEEAWVAICSNARFMRDALRIGRAGHINHPDPKVVGWPWR